MHNRTMSVSFATIASLVKEYSIIIPVPDAYKIDEWKYFHCVMRTDFHCIDGLALDDDKLKNEKHNDFHYYLKAPIGGNHLSSNIPQFIMVLSLTLCAFEAWE